LDLREPPERLERASPCARGQFGALDELANVRVVTVVMVVVCIDPKMECSDALSLDALDIDRDTLDPERGGHRAKRLELRTGIEQHREEHVARKAADAIEVEAPSGQVTSCHKRRERLPEQA